MEDHSQRITVDADPWLRRLGLPYYTLAILRDMRIDDEVVLFDYDGPCIVPGGDTPGRVAALVERVKGQWRYEALWMIGVGKCNMRRGTIWTFGTFKVEKGRRLSWPEKDMAAMRLFERVVRLSNRLARMARASGDKSSSKALTPYPYRNYGDVLAAAPFLTTLVPPPRTGLPSTSLAAGQDACDMTSHPEG
ncbi:hypothetical protein G3O06_23445 [Burkholderia sp. Ac-20345]|uniref:hypothetical protein n=1 Tax=Burkholderia sp. Ac-20345 TaxID=2703891 RepID=UPI00197BB30B|nr:hypothetical protein [Burkholderia sp. Ac-20345]MBN3780472.1 hypothetical protein [Burkholderia sp. Ac-20345]